MVLPSSKSFFWPPDKFPAGSLDRCFKFKNSITSYAFFLISSSSDLNFFLINIAFINFSPDWLDGTIIRFSSTVRLVNSWAIWKVLKIPLENNSYDGSPVILLLLNITFPSFGFSDPAIKLNNVLLPDPFGPIIPVIVPFFIFNEQFFTAAKPPKFFDKLEISNM